MATTTLNIRTDQAVKDQAEQLFSELGLNMTTAVNLFLRAALRQQGIPFDLTLDTPGAATAAAIAQGRRLLSDPAAARYDDMDALRAALDV